MTAKKTRDLPSDPRIKLANPTFERQVVMVTIEVSGMTAKSIGTKLSTAFGDKLVVKAFRARNQQVTPEPPK